MSTGFRPGPTAGGVTDAGEVGEAAQVFVRPVRQGMGEASPHGQGAAEAEKEVSGDARTEFEAVLDEIPGDEDLQKGLRKLRGAILNPEEKKKAWATIRCKHCRRDGRYEVEHEVITPRGAAMAIKALKDWMEMTKGKPVERKRHEHIILDARSLSELSSEQIRAELHALREQGEVVDGEYRELPA